MAIQIAYTDAAGQVTAVSGGSADADKLMRLEGAATTSNAPV